MQRNSQPADEQPRAVLVNESKPEVLVTTDTPGAAGLRIWQSDGIHILGYYNPRDPDAAKSGYVTLTGCTRTELENLAEAISMYLEALECAVP